MGSQSSMRKNAPKMIQAAVSQCSREQAIK
jgi:hypothetical protein